MIFLSTKTMVVEKLTYMSLIDDFTCVIRFFCSYNFFCKFKLFYTIVKYSYILISSIIIDKIYNTS